MDRTEFTLLKTWTVDGKAQHEIHIYDAASGEQIIEVLRQQYERVDVDHPETQPSVEAVATGRLWISSRAWFYTFELHLSKVISVLGQPADPPFSLFSTDFTTDGDFDGGVPVLIAPVVDPLEGDTVRLPPVPEDLAP